MYEKGLRLETTSSSSKNKIGSMGGSELISLYYLIRRCWIFLLLLAITCASAAIWEHRKFPSYHAKTTIYFQSADTNPLQALAAKLSGEGAATSSGNDFPEKYLQLLMSYPFALEASEALTKSKDFSKVQQDVFFQRQNVMDWLSDYFAQGVKVNRSFKDASLEDVADAVQGWVTYTRAESGGVNISINTPDPQLSLILANLISSTAVKSITSQNLKELTEAEKYLNQEIKSTESKLQNVELNIVDFKRTNKLVTMEQGVTGVITRLDSIKQELDDVNLEIDQNNSQLEKLRVRGSGSEKRDVMGSMDVSRFGRSGRIRELEEKARFFKTRRTSLTTALKSMVGAQDPHSEQRVFDLKKKVELEYSHFQDLERQAFQVELQKIAAANKINVLAPVREANITRTVPLMKKILLSLLFSLVVGVCLASLQEFFSPVVKSREDFENLEIGFLAAIPDLDRGFFRKKIHGNLSNQTFKHICTRLLHLSRINERELQVVSILSPMISDGKSFISTNLGSAFAQTGKKTLIIDMAASVKHGAPGLIDILRGDEKFAKVCIQDISPGLDLLPGGSIKDDLSSLLNSSVMAQFMEDVRYLYSYVIIDTLPLSVSVDSVVFSKFSDASVVIAITNGTSLQDIERLTGLMSDSNQKPIFGILNRFPASKSSLFKPIYPDQRSQGGKASEKIA